MEYSGDLKFTQEEMVRQKISVYQYFYKWQMHTRIKNSTNIKYNW